MAEDIRTNYSVKKIKSAGLKDQLKGYQFRLKFFNFSDSNEKDTLNVMENGNDIILYTKKITGLPELKINEVEDNFYGFKSYIPTTPEFTSHVATVTFRITEDLNPIKPLMDRLLVILQSQLSLTNELAVVTDDSTNDISLGKVPIETYEALLTTDDLLLDDISEDFFFDATISLQEYNTKKSILTYVLKNSWISRLKIADSVGEDVQIINGEFDITFDYPEIYKPNNVS